MSDELKAGFIVFVFVGAFVAYLVKIFLEDTNV
jgi:hypothetical protein